MSGDLAAVVSPPTAGEAEATGAPARRVDVRRVCRQLQLAGVELIAPCNRGTAVGGGAPLGIDAGVVLASEAATSQLRQQLHAVAASGLPLSVSISGLGTGDGATERFGRICQLLQAFQPHMSEAHRALHIAVDAETRLLQALLRVRQTVLGVGHTYVLAGNARFRSDEKAALNPDDDRFWAELWRRRASPRTHVMLAPEVMPQCPLLSAETAKAVLPALGIQVPAGTSWLVMRLDLTRFADAAGVLCETELEHALHSCVDAGDALHDAASWPTSAMRQDAGLNRRLAIQVTGLGDLVELRRIDPCDVEALKNLDELLRWTRSTLQARSHLIAKSTGLLPAIEQSDPSRLLPCAVVREDWRQRWRHTADETAVRHRNLLVLSPWSIFPTRSRADFRYADLVPILLHADACAVQRSVSLSHWNVNEFKRFSQRAWAVLQRRSTTTLIAKGV